MAAPSVEAAAALWTVRLDAGADRPAALQAPSWGRKRKKAPLPGRAEHRALHVRLVGPAADARLMCTRLAAARAWPRLEEARSGSSKERQARPDIEVKK